MSIYLDATTLIALGTIGELGLPTVFNRELIVRSAVRKEIASEPANTNLKRFLILDEVQNQVGAPYTYVEESRGILGERASQEGMNGDVAIVASVLRELDEERSVSVISDDRRVRTVTRGLGATVTGTVGVVVRAVSDGELTADEGKDLVRRIDGNGLHMTGELREKAYELIDEAAEERG